LRLFKGKRVGLLGDDVTSASVPTSRPNLRDSSITGWAIRRNFSRPPNTKLNSAWRAVNICPRGDWPAQTIGISRFGVG